MAPRKILTEDHREVDVILADLFEAFDRGDAERARVLLDHFRKRLSAHIRAEDLYLFPAVLRAFRSRHEGDPSFEFVQSSIRNLENDHGFFMRELGGAVKEMFDARDEGHGNHAKNLVAVRESVEAVVCRLELHNSLEEANVYEWTDALGIEEKVRLNAKIQQELATAEAL